MGIFAKYDYLPHKKKWLGVIFEADSAYADPSTDKITVLTIETAGTREEIEAWVSKAMELREWEPRN